MPDSIIKYVIVLRKLSLAPTFLVIFFRFFKRVFQVSYFDLTLFNSFYCTVLVNFSLNFGPITLALLDSMSDKFSFHMATSIFVWAFVHLSLLLFFPSSSSTCCGTFTACGSCVKCSGCMYCKYGGWKLKFVFFFLNVFRQHTQRCCFFNERHEKCKKNWS